MWVWRRCHLGRVVRRPLERLAAVKAVERKIIPIFHVHASTLTIK